MSTSLPHQPAWKRLLPPVTLGLATVVMLADQATKGWVLATLEHGERVAVTGFFNLVLTYNRGVAFGLLASDYWWKPYLLVGIALLIVGGLLLWLRSQAQLLPRLATGLIVGGAVGNVIDRFRQPGVVDFLDFHLNGYHWPAFNLADCAIVIGVGLLLLDGLFTPASKR
ncbi:signal peptidase II [Algihabitans albus]|uniref:signal peptidase II n=1 Tax=Algihabitans albus TaxID=2164067 RepID=UPI001F3FE13C|nr:signal peptidase II [Algihabitans albus]